MVSSMFPAPLNPGTYPFFSLAFFSLYSLKELSDEDPQGFRNFLRMDTRVFFLNNAETECSTNVHLIDIVHITAESAWGVYTA
jgi:hypothetical protein